MNERPAPPGRTRRRTFNVLMVLGAVVALGLANYVFRNEGLTPLCRARTAGEARSLIDGGVRVDARTRRNCTALHFAAGRGLPNVVQVLLERGVAPNVAGDRSETPLHWVARVFWDPDDGQHALREQRDPAKLTESARLLLEHGADPNAKDFRGRTPLFDAAYSGNVGLVKVLLEHGAVAAVSDTDGHTPLHVLWNAEIARLLLAHGADVNARDRWEHRTPLHYATCISNEVAHVLKEHGGTK